MSNVAHRSVARLLVGVLLVLPAAWVAAQPATGAGEQPSFVEFAAGAQIRDAALDAERGWAYLAVYDRNEVWKADLFTGETIAKASTGRGPAAVALSSDGKTVLTANFLTGNATLLDAADLSLLATVDCGPGPGDVAALPGGGFAVVCTFADSVTIIDPAQPEAPTVLQGVSGVPNGVAASMSVLAVTMLAPPAVQLFRAGADRPETTIPLPGNPVSLAALPGDRFAVATGDALVLIDGTANAIASELAFPAIDVTARDGHIVALTETEVVVFDGALAEQERFLVEQPGRAVAATEQVLAVLSPQARVWRVHGSYEPGPALARRDADQRMAPPAPGVESEPTQIATAPEERVAPRRRVYSVPLGGGEPRAETPAHRRGPEHWGEEEGQTLAEAIEEGIALGSGEGGFQLPDLRAPLKNLTARQVTDVRGDLEEIIAEGDVRLTLDTATLTSDYMYLNQQTGELNIRGNVHIAQASSNAYADEVRYVIPLGEQLETPPLSAQEKDIEEDFTRKLLTLGSLDAINIEIIEPTRRLKADRIVYDFANETGEAYHVIGESGTFYFAGERLAFLGPERAEGEDMWLTSCDPEHDYYKIRLKRGVVGEGGALEGRGAQLVLGKMKTPIYWPVWSAGGGDAPTVGFDIDSGHRAELGYYLNIGQQFAVTPNVQLGYRIWPTSEEGVGVGLEGEYSFLQEPASLLYRSSGKFRTLYTTKSRGFFEWYHRHELLEDTVLLAQAEQWFDADFYKDFYYDEYRDRGEPRTFINVTHTRPTYIATATGRFTTNNFVAETERLPEVTFHLLERKLAPNLYVSFDTVDGYNEREPAGTHSVRSANIGRLTYDLELAEGLNLTPFAELEATWYSDTAIDGESDFRLSSTLGATAQSRLHKTYPGRWGFSAFKHLVVPSVTYSYRPQPAMGFEETPRFDAYDNVYGRSRIESKLDNLLFGKDAETGDTWQLARLTLYQGNDFSNEFREAKDLEVELDLRLRPWWGFQVAAEHHGIDNETSLDQPYFAQRRALELYEQFAGEPFDLEKSYLYNAVYGDYDRMMAFLYYDDSVRGGRMNGRLGYAYTATQGQVFNREIMYGLGYNLNEKWSVAFEHRYDIENGDLYRQRYEIRRVFHCLESAITIQERRSGWDVSFEIGVTGLPGTKLKF